MKRARVRLGTYGPRLFRRSLALSPATAQTHMHLIGVSGSGKSRYLAHLYLELLKQQFAVWLIDPHGDLCKLILGHLVEQGFYNPQNAGESPVDRLLYLDIPEAEQRGLYLPFNPLRAPGSPHTIASNIKESLHRAWPSLAGGSAPMFDTLVQDGVKVLVSRGQPLTSLYRLITDKRWRDELLELEEDPDIVAFWHDQFDRLSEKDRVDQAGAALRRAHLLTFSPTLKYSLGQDENVLNFRELFDKRRSLLINLAVGDHEARRLLGCLFTVFAEQGALSRLELPPEQRRGTTFLVIDEVTEFVAQSEDALTRMLSQSRKVGLFLVGANQSWSQTSERLRGALQNVGIQYVGRLGREDAEYTARMLAKVNPRTLRQTIDEESAESAGMAEQREEMIQELMDLRTGQGFVVINNVPQYPFPLRLVVQRSPRRVQKLTAPHVRDVAATPELRAVEEEYMARYFTPQARVMSSLAERRGRRRRLEPFAKPDS